jgi:glycyl-tRNA synthetase
MQLWWKMFVEERGDMFGVDAAILMNQKVWQASGHVSTFTDPLVECGHCHSRFRVDKIIDKTKYKNFLSELDRIHKNHIQSKLDELDEYTGAIDYYESTLGENLSDDVFEELKTSLAELENDAEVIVAMEEKLKQAHEYLGSFVQYLLNEYSKCSVCGHKEWGIPKTFNMMFRTHIGPVDEAISEPGKKIIVQTTDPTKLSGRVEERETVFRSMNNDTSLVYLRPETAQGIFTNYKNVVDSLYPDLPFGLAQQGKAFRNEISPRDFVFRSREFEQMEIEYFVHPEKWEEAFEAWRKQVHEWLKALGLPDDKVHELEVPADDLAHYSKRTIDFEFDYPHGKDEILGLAYRTDFDLGNIQRASGKSMEYRPKDGSTPFVPHVIEPSFGVERAIMAVLVAAYTEDEINGEKRTVLKLPKHLAPIKAAVSPLLKNKPELVEKAREVYGTLHKELGAVMWDDNGNIGKRYRRQDEIGTPACVTIDFQTLEDNTVTVRDRDTAQQTRVNISDLVNQLK